jgi:hypothetical protein
MFSLIAAITFDPTIRGILVVAVAVAVLPGSIFMIISTNTGVKLGILITLAGLFGWIFLMSSVWWMYGIGLKGPRSVVAGHRSQHVAGFRYGHRAGQFASPT